MRENFKNEYETTLFYFLEDYAHLWRLDVLLIQNSVEKDDFAKMKNLLTTLHNIKFIHNLRIQFKYTNILHCLIAQLLGNKCVL